MSNDLDGTYRISTVSNYDGPLVRRSDGETVLVNGQTERRDGNNVLWTSTFRQISDTEVEMVSVADPTDADAEFALLQPNGAPTREKVTYTSILRLARKGAQIQMSGDIQYGHEIILITMRKIVEDKA